MCTDSFVSGLITVALLLVLSLLASSGQKLVW
jgi:hypothetical protein